MAGVWSGGQAGPGADAGNTAVLGRLRRGRTAHPALRGLRAALFLPAPGLPGVRWFTASGRATLYSYVINPRPAPGFEDDMPYAIAVGEVGEGPRMMPSIVGLPATPEALELDM